LESVGLEEIVVEFNKTTVEGGGMGRCSSTRGDEKGSLRVAPRFCREPENEETFEEGENISARKKS
jgi:hypothetical protein